MHFVRLYAHRAGLYDCPEATAEEKREHKRAPNALGGNNFLARAKALKVFEIDFVSNSQLLTL